MCLGRVDIRECLNKFKDVRRLYKLVVDILFLSLIKFGFFLIHVHNFQKYQFCSHLGMYILQPVFVTILST